ncbi:hypothetical protein [Ruminococcus callidus]|uniref:hypothetical protein n=1 Tax=Ruminococcus TaxID=1263 RepID=UPI001D0057C0|nr:hypothetical protein [Ruminococcus callidus]
MEKYGADAMTCISYCSKGGYIGDFQRVSAAPMECRSMCQHPENLANWERKGGAAGGTQVFRYGRAALLRIRAAALPQLTESLPKKERTQEKHEDEKIHIVSDCCCYGRNHRADQCAGHTGNVVYGKRSRR